MKDALDVFSRFTTATMFISFLIFILVFLMIQKSGKKKINCPPSAQTPMAELFKVILGDNGPDWLIQNFQELGSIFNINLIPFFNCFIIGDGPTVRKILEDPSTDKPLFMYARFNSIFGSSSLLTLGDDMARKKRKLFTKSFSPGRIGMMKDVFWKKVREWEEGSHFQNLVKNDTPVDICKEMSELTMNIISEAAFEYPLSHEEYNKYTVNIELGCREYLNRQALQPWRKLVALFLKETREAARAVEEMQMFAQKIMDHYLKLENPTPGTVMDVIMNSDAYENDNQRIAEILFFFFAGHDTSSLTLSWTLLYLGRDSELQESIFDEISKEIEMDKIASSSVIRNLMNEGLRIQPVTTFGVMKRVTKDIVTSCPFGYDIPKRSIVYGCPLVAHRNEKYFEKPDEFIPSRWDTMNTSTTSTSTSSKSFFPFSLGPRTCIGQALATTEMRVILATIVKKYKVEVASEGKPVCFLLHKPEGVMLLFKKRHA